VGTEARSYVRRTLPVTYLPQITTPVQLLHWDGDLRCPAWGRPDEVFQGLKRLGRESSSCAIRRVPHREDAVPACDFVRRHLDWFAAH